MAICNGKFYRLRKKKNKCGLSRQARPGQARPGDNSPTELVTELSIRSIGKPYPFQKYGELLSNMHIALSDNILKSLARESTFVQDIRLENVCFDDNNEAILIDSVRSEFISHLEEVLSMSLLAQLCNGNKPVVKVEGSK